MSGLTLVRCCYMCGLAFLNVMLFNFGTRSEQKLSRKVHKYLPIRLFAQIFSFPSFFSFDVPNSMNKIWNCKGRSLGSGSAACWSSCWNSNFGTSFLFINFSLDIILCVVPTKKVLPFEAWYLCIMHMPSPNLTKEHKGIPLIFLILVDSCKRARCYV